jgi:NAD(P)-dependent dehydrogenase (short-subunit alcohol dehydrogenase family)
MPPPEQEGGEVAAGIAGATVLVTGGNTGLGKETAVELARMGAHVTFTSRDRDRGAAALAEITERSGRDDVEVLHLDLGDLDDVVRATAAFAARHDRLDVLVLNAGVCRFGRRRETAQGFEEMFGVNHLGHALLTFRLQDLVVASAPSRVVVLSSDGHRIARDGLDWDDLQHVGSYDGFTVYGHSKLANVYFTVELADRLGGHGVTVTAVHPGFVETELGRTRPEDRPPGSAPSGGSKVDTSAFGTPLPVAEGARTQIWAASAPEAGALNGRYLSECAPVELGGPAADRAAAARLWSVTEELLAPWLGVPAATP